MPRQFIKVGLTLLVAALILSGPTRGRPLPALPRPALAEAAAAPSRAAAVSTLEPGRPLTRELSAGEVHAYEVTLDAGLYFHATVESQGADAALTLTGPGGRELLRRDCRRRAPTPVSHVAEAAGVYRLEVRGSERGQGRGRYELRAEAARPAAEGDQRRAAAEAAFAEGERLLKEWEAEASRAAIDKFREALSLWESVGDLREEAHALKHVGDVQQSFSQFQEALDSYNQALTLYRKVTDLRGEADTLNEMSLAHIAVGENAKALRQCTRALRLSRAAGDRFGEAQALNHIGEVYNWSGEVQKALDYYYKALPLWAALGDRPGTARTHTYLGFTFSDLGQTQKAFESYHLALSLWQAVDDRRWAGATLTALGRLHSRLGENQQALNFFNEAIRLVRPIGDPIGEARILNGMAYIYAGLGESKKSLEYYGRALSLHQGIKYLNGVKNTLYDIGGVYYSLKDYDRALEHYELDYQLSRATADKREQSYALGGIGMVYEARGDKAKALENYSRALAFYESEKDLRGEADTLNLIGRIHEGWGQARKTLDYYNRALALSRQAHYRFGEAATLYNIARVERERGNLEEARLRAEAALDLVEALRTSVASQSLRTSYFATVRQHYELYIDVLMSLRARHPAGGLDARAFEVSERARARSLLESLAASRGQIRQGVDPTLLERERSLRQQLSAKSERQASVLGGPHTKGEAAAVAAEVEALAREYDAVEAEIRTRSPHYATLMQPQPLGLEEIQRRVLDDESVLLEYALGDERSYVWAVTRAGVAGYELPGRARIEEAARRFYELMKARQRVPGEAAAQHRERAARADADYRREADALGRMILGPVARHLAEGRRLLVVADGALQYVPFGALAPPGAELSGAAEGGLGPGGAQADGGEGERAPLLTRHEIVNLPSASILPSLRREAAALASSAPRKAVAVFADPVFDRDDPRVRRADSSGAGADPRGASAGTLAEDTQLHRAVGDAGALFGGEGVPRLMASREEADAIAAALPRGEVEKVTGFGASRAAAVEPGLARHRVIHFATHGILDSERPEMSGIVLSLVDERGEPQDGFLSLQDIYNLDLPADLVVLSACNTALGREVRGEGLVGLTRGFMYAGAGAVVASLWKVDDEATAELMGHFYEGMFRRGLAPPAALRQAQLAMWRQKRWSAPYYWAAFVIQGQYGELEGGRAAPAARASWGLAAWGGGTAAISFAALFALRSRRRRRTLAGAGTAKV